MGWETRGNGTYYYRSIRVDGRPCRVYLGRGDAARKVANEVVRRRAERQARAEALQAARERYVDALSHLENFCEFTDLLLKAALIEQGYHQHNHGAWRRRRHVSDHSDSPAENVSGRTEGDRRTSQPG